MGIVRETLRGTMLFLFDDYEDREEQDTHCVVPAVPCQQRGTGKVHLHSLSKKKLAAYSFIRYRTFHVLFGMAS